MLSGITKYYLHRRKAVPGDGRKEDFSEVSGSVFVEPDRFDLFKFQRTSAGTYAVVEAAIVGVLSTIFIFVLHPSLGVRDADGFAYLIGGYSLHEGKGYRSLVGEPLNHWPPGYSLLLSVFDNGLLSAEIINYCSLGVTLGLLYFLLRQSGWSWQAAFGLSVGLGGGFFRLLANSVHADILTYALFLIAICAASQSRRVLSSLILAFLIPIKFIAVVLLPAMIGADILVSRWSWSKLLRTYLPGVIGSVACVVGLLIFNRLTLHDWVPSSYGESSPETLLTGTKNFFISIPREFLFNWYGSIRSPFAEMAFCACMVTVAGTLISLRPAPERRWFSAFGILCLVCSGLLLVVRAYGLHVRLLGYGLIALFLGFRPRPWANPIWFLYGLVSIVTGIVNAITINCVGSMDARYGALASQVGAEYKDARALATNSFHILDLHAGIPSVPVTDYGEAANYDGFLWVTLPNYDPGANAVTPMAGPGPEWCERSKFAGGILFKRCETLRRSTEQN